MLEVREVSKSFGLRRVLDGVTFDVAPGELVALVGENGAGKSTLVKCLGGLLDPDGGHVRVAGTTAAQAIARGRLGIVWQDLALCDNLDVVANVFLGAERGRRRLLDDGRMHLETRRLFDRIGIGVGDLRRPVAQLSGGQRQLVAVARALLSSPDVLVLDEPTAALGVNEAGALEGVLRSLRAQGVALLLVSHRIEQVFALADRVVVLRNGYVTADVATVEAHPDDVIALISGVATDSAARRQLRQLRSLVDQLAEVEPSASLPLIVSALSAALGLSRVSVHLREGRPDDPAAPLVRRAAVGLHPALWVTLAQVDTTAVAAGDITARAAETGSFVLREDTRDDPLLGQVGIASVWAIPIVGSKGVLGVITAYSDVVGVPRQEEVELAMLHANLAAAAIERERLLDEVSRRNRVLESLRAMLERLAGPAPVEGGVGIALLPLCQGVGADAAALFEQQAVEAPTCLVAVGADGSPPPDDLLVDLAGAAAGVLDGPTALARARLVGSAVVAVPVVLPEGRGVLLSWWADPQRISDDALDLLDDAARSFALAMERVAAEAAQKESETLRVSNRRQRDFLYRLSHELRTPLTAIWGYADTLRQTDVTWSPDAQQQFLDRIAAESARMSRLVGDLLDTSALESGGLRLQPDWCDVDLVAHEAAAVVDGPASGSVTVAVEGDLPPIWADHDRIEQVLVNLLDNAMRHGAPPVELSATRTPDGAAIELRVRDRGQGFAPDIATRAFDAHARVGPASGAGLGLTIARGIVEGHGGTITIGPAPCGGAEVVVVLPVEPVDAIRDEVTS